MLSLFKNIKWFEWVFIGLLIAGGLGLWFFYDRYTDGLVEKGGLVEKNFQLETTLEIKGKSSAITDDAITQFTTQKVDELREMEQSRAGVIDEYINLSGQSQVKWPESKDVPVEKTRVEPLQQDPPATVQADSGTGTNNALSVLSNRMYEHYCKAKRLDEKCGPK